MKAIECKNLIKIFGKREVLKGVDLTLETGKVYALLGRNGAGKTTLLNCICTRYLPNEGEVFLLEEPAYENRNVLKEICFMSDSMDAFESCKIKEILAYAKHFYKGWDEKLEERLLELYELKKSELYMVLSKGKKTAVSLIVGLCSGCQVVLFDEIYSGLDAVARKQFYEILLEEQDKKERTFILSTHLIGEMAMLFDEVIIIDQGKIVFQEEMESIEEKAFRVTGRMEEDMLTMKNVLSKKDMGAMAEYYIYDSFVKEERENLKEKGMILQNMSLQDLFIAITEKGKSK